MNENHDAKGLFSSGGGGGGPSTPEGHQGDLFGAHQKLDDTSAAAHEHTKVDPEYDRASAEQTAASKEFAKATAAYRARTIGDKEYLKARGKMDKANKAFDAAYAKRAGWT